MTREDTIDLARCRRGMAQLRVEGFPRPALIEEAIAAIQKAPTNALMVQYFGIKNYAGFGDQREDHEYGYGPRHGSIVFRIERTDEALRTRKALDADAIYYLEAYRDFGTTGWVEREPGRVARDVRIALDRAIRLFDDFTAQRNKLADVFEAVRVESHPIAVDGGTPAQPEAAVPSNT